jgi:hypothetical protein
VSEDRPLPSFAQLIESEFDDIDPAEANKLFRLGLQTALEKLADRYGVPMNVVSELYRKQGCLEETEKLLSSFRAREYADEADTLRRIIHG